MSNLESDLNLVILQFLSCYSPVFSMDVVYSGRVSVLPPLPDIYDSFSQVRFLHSQLKSATVVFVFVVVLLLLFFFNLL